MLDCRLFRNRKNKRCKALKSIRYKDKKDLSFKEAKLRYPKLRAFGDADKDGVKNKKDCRPFNKHKHMVALTDSNGEKIIYAHPKEYKGFKKIVYGRKMGLPPIETHKELKEDGLTGNEMRNALTLFEASQKGVKIEEGIPKEFAEGSYNYESTKDPTYPRPSAGEYEPGNW
jgi:hypothetical protein